MATLTNAAPGHQMARLSADDLRAIAEAQNAEYPQYRGHWDGPEWIVVRFNRDVRTKMGLAFRKGEYALAQAVSKAPGEGLYPNVPFRTAYSTNNRIDTSVRTAWTEVL